MSCAAFCRRALVEAVEAAELRSGTLVVVDTEVDERRRTASDSRCSARRPGSRRTADRGCRRPRPGRVEASRSRRASGCSGSRLERLRERVDGLARDEDVPLRGVARRRAAAGPVHGTARPCSSRPGPRRRRRRAAGARGPGLPRSAARRPRSAASPSEAARGRRARSAGSPRPAWRRRRRGARPTGRPTRRRGTSTASRRPTALPRGRTRRSSTSRRPRQSYVSAVRSSSSRSRRSGRNEHAGDLRVGRVPPSRLPACQRARHRPSRCVCLPELVGPGRFHPEHVVRQLELALDRDLGHALPGRAEPALSHSSTVSPGSGVISSTPGRELRELLGRSLQEREGAVVARHAALDSEQLQRDRRLGRGHREVAADREHGHVRLRRCLRISAMSPKTFVSPAK